MAEENININIQYDVRGIDQSVRSTQRLLFTMNAVRLSVRDIQEVMSGPTAANLLWTGIQLTRTWTNLYRLINATNRIQQTGAARGVIQAATGAGLQQGILGVGAGGAVTVGKPGMGGILGATIAFLSANPIVAGAVLAATVTTGAVLWKRNQDEAYQEWLRRQREIAKSQGFEY